VSLAPKPLKSELGITEETETEAKDKREMNVVLDLRKSDEDGMVKE